MNEVPMLSSCPENCRIYPASELCTLQRHNLEGRMRGWQRYEFSVSSPSLEIEHGHGIAIAISSNTKALVVHTAKKCGIGAHQRHFTCPD